MSQSRTSDSSHPAFIVQPLDNGVVDAQRISAVFVVAFRGDAVLAVRNERGWDLPGGHVEPGEPLEQAIAREVYEEATTVLEGLVPIATLAVATLATAHRTMLVYTARIHKMDTFTPTADALARELLPPGELVRRYHGDHTLLRRLIELAQDHTDSTPQRRQR